MIKEPLKWIWGSPNVRKPLNLIHRCRIYTYVINMKRYVLLMCIDHMLGPTEMWYLFPCIFKPSNLKSDVRDTSCLGDRGHNWIQRRICFTKSAFGNRENQRLMW